MATEMSTAELEKKFKEEYEKSANQYRKRPNILVVCFENGGGAIFDMLPQASDEPYFERLFLTPQQVDFGPICQGFGVPYTAASTLEKFERALDANLGVPGISFIGARLPLRGVRERYGKYW